MLERLVPSWWHCLGGSGDTDLLEKACHCRERGCEVLYAQAMSSVECILLLLPADQDVELSAPSPAPSLPTCCHASCHDDELNL